MDRHLANTQIVAEWLSAHTQVESISYAGLSTSSWHPMALKYAPKGPGALLSFEIRGGVEAGRKFVEGVKMFSHVANIGDVRSLIIHPASTTHAQLNEDEQRGAGITPGLIRLSIGLENIDDIKADLAEGFLASR